jgi:ribonuclease P protein component
MLPKENRLTRRDDFSKVYKKGFYSQLKNITVKFLRTETNSIRIGFSVGKNFSKLATKRNSARRILREGAARHLTELKNGVDMVIILQPNKNNPHDFDLSFVENSLHQIFSKNNLFK